MNKRGYTLIELLFVVGILGLAIVVLCGGTLWTERSLNFWMSYTKGHSVHCPLWLAAIVTIVGNGFTLVGNVVSEMARFYLTH